MKYQFMNNSNIGSVLKDYAVITFGLLVCSIGWVVFMLPNHITQGGMPGVSSVLEWGLNIPVQYTYFALNAILLAIALKVLGPRFCLKTIYAVAAVTLFIPILRAFMGDTHLLNGQPFLAAVIGGSFMGSGVGLCLAHGGSSGGTDVVAAMVNKYHDISLGHIILMVDVVIIASSYVVLKDWNQVIYGYVELMAASFCVDHVVNLTRRSVQFIIVSERYEELSQLINEEAKRGCTVIDGRGSYSGNEVHMLFVLAKQREASRIFQLINDVDPKAFVSQSAVIGVYGEGFDHFKGVKKDKSSDLHKSEKA